MCIIALGFLSNTLELLQPQLRLSVASKRADLLDMNNMKYVNGLEVSSMQLVWRLRNFTHPIFGRSYVSSDLRPLLERDAARGAPDRSPIDSWIKV